MPQYDAIRYVREPSSITVIYVPLEYRIAPPNVHYMLENISEYHGVRVLGIAVHHPDTCYVNVPGWYISAPLNGVTTEHGPYLNHRETMRILRETFEDYDIEGE